MARFSELDSCIRELRTAAQAITNAADSLTDFYSGKPKPAEPELELPTLNEPLTAPPPQEDLTPPAKPPPKSKAKAKSKKAEPPQVTSITIDELRELIATTAQSGFRIEVKELLAKYGSGKLSTVPPENYEKLKSEVEGLHKNE